MSDSISGLIEEFSQACRLILRRPKLFAISALILSLGIGMSTALFSIVYGVLLRPLPFENQNRLVVMWKVDREGTSHVGELSYPEFQDWQRQSRSFASMAAMPTTVYGYSVDLSGYGRPVELERTPVSAQFFDVLGVHPALGRTFLASDDRVGAQPTVILTHALWTNEFHSDSSLIGRQISLSGQGYTVIGVMPAGFDFPRGAQLWTPLGINQGWMKRGATFLEVVGRLRYGVSPNSAKSEIGAIMTRVAAEYPAYADPRGELPVLTRLPNYIFGMSKPAILLLWAASLLLLTIACFNVVSLLVARTLLREREIAVRAALGATRSRLLRQFLAEGLVLSCAGAIGGWFAAQFLLKLARAFGPSGIPRLISVHLNMLSLVFACGVAIIIAMAFGCAPALLMTKRDLRVALGENGGRTAGGQRGAFLRRCLLAGEAVVTMILLSSAAMVAHNFYALEHAPLGFAPQKVLTAQIKSNQMDPEQRNTFFVQLLERFRSQSDVEAAGAILLRPFEGAIGWDRQYRARGQDAYDANNNPTANLESITPGYFRAAGTPLLAGRDFSLDDSDSHQKVVIVSASLARREFGGVQRAIGKQLGMARAATPEDQDWRTIVGVVADAQYRKLGIEQGDIFLPFLQTYIPVRYVIVRTRTDPASFAPILRQDVEAIDENLAVSKMRPMVELIADAQTGPRFSMLLFSAFGAFAGLLACVGVYGVVSDSVVQRKREMGIRMALGAQRWNILKVSIQNEIGAVMLGGAVGFVVSLGMARVYAHLLYGLQGIDYPSALTALVVLSSVTIASSFVPVLRVIKVSVAKLLLE